MSQPSSGTPSQRLHVDVEGCLVVGGVHDPRMASAVGQWVATAEAPATVTVWSAVREFADDGAAWLSTHLQQSVSADLKTSEALRAITAQYTVVDDDPDVLAVAAARGANALRPAQFIDRFAA